MTRPSVTTKNPLQEAAQQGEEDTDVELIPDFFAQVRKRPKLSGDVIALRSTVDNTHGPFTVYIFVASLMHDGTAAPLGTVVLDDHY